MNEQTSLFPTNQFITACALTGHRELQDDFSPERLWLAVDDAIANGCSRFYCGMAVGFDLLAAECVLMHQNAELVAVLPFYGQERNYSDEDKARYVAILHRAKEVVTVENEFRRWGYMKRNRYMVEHADALICYLRKKEGGTKKTLDYFLKRKNGTVYYL